MHGSSTPRTLNISTTLWATIELMSQEMGVGSDALVNQALFSWARLNGYLETSPIDAPSSEEVPRPRRAWLTFRGQRVAVEGSRFLLGRDLACQLTIDSAGASRHHAVIVTSPELIEIEDLRSANGTWVNGSRVTRRALAEGDELRIGDVLLRVSVD